TGSIPAGMVGPNEAKPPANSASVDSVTYWTIPGGYAWSFHTITVTGVPFSNAEFKAIEFTTQKHPTTGLISGLSPATDYEGVERTFGGSGSSTSPYLNVVVDYAAGTVKVTLLTAWTMPSKDSPNRRFVIRVKNVRHDNSKNLVTCWPGTNL